MDLAALRGIDLNLLVTFQALIQDNSVSKAAARLHVSQGTVSAALGRLRSTFHDPLFQRTRTGMVPTAKALELAPHIAQMLALADVFLSPQKPFDPYSSAKRFHLAMSDDLELFITPRLLDTAHKNGWSTTFSVHQTNSAIWEKTLDAPEIDLVLCASPPKVTSDYRETVLFSATYACIFNPVGEYFSRPITLAEYQAADHIRVSYNTRRGFVDEYFELQGHVRKVTVSLSHFAGLTTALHHPGTVATLPKHAAQEIAAVGGYTLEVPPIPVPATPVSLLWRLQSDSQPEHRWLRRLIQKIAIPEP